MFDTNKRLKKVSFALILAVVLTLSVFSVSALENGGVADLDAYSATIDASLIDGGDDGDGALLVTNEAPTDDDVPANDITDVAVDADKEEESKFGLPDIISLAVLGVVITIIVIYCLTHKEKTGKFFRGLKSEFKKISWTPWNQVRKNTLVVLVVVIAVAIVIGIADFAFNRGIEAIGKVF